jgi:DNA-binding CsgD family transcriptional regulator
MPFPLTNVKYARRRLRRVDLDATDQAILRLLREDARLSFREIARRVGVSTPTVATKVRQLEALGVIQGYRAVLAGEEAEPAPAPKAVAVACHECKGPIHGAGTRRAWAQDGGRDHWFCCRGCAGAFEARLIARSHGVGKR